MAEIPITKIPVTEIPVIEIHMTQISMVQIPITEIYDLRNPIMGISAIKIFIIYILAI